MAYAREMPEDHRKSCPYGVQLDMFPAGSYHGIETPSRNGHGQHIVHKGPSKVDPNATKHGAAEIQKCDDSCQLRCCEDKGCATDGHVASRSYGDAHIGSGERGGVVDSVADHGDSCAFGRRPACVEGGLER
ncbi:hypothetical protein HG531_005393 [Fusarium graminearum]|nr:hypothetical protein HG531_005393 [Fusarium graminearum]